MSGEETLKVLALLAMLLVHKLALELSNKPLLTIVSSRRSQTHTHPHIQYTVHKMDRPDANTLYRQRLQAGRYLQPPLDAVFA